MENQPVYNAPACVQDMRVVFIDGTVLDTADPKSCEAFMKVRE